jgi:hypothetical protein
MKEFFFVMSMFTNSGQLPPHIEPMPSLQECYRRVEHAADAMAKDEPGMNGDFRFTAGCLIKSTKADPA